MDVSANGTRVRFFRDVANVTEDMNGIENLNVNALGSADNIHIGDLTGTDLKTANVDLSSPPGSGTGDGAADTVTADGTNGPDHVQIGTVFGNVLVSGLHTQLQIAGSEAANDTLKVNTLGGRDRVTVAPEVSQLINPVVDLGADQ